MPATTRASTQVLPAHNRYIELRMLRRNIAGCLTVKRI